MVQLTDHLINREWKNILNNEFKENYFKHLIKIIQNNKRFLCPKEELIFRSLNLTSYNNVKVVILAQDPYHTPNVADGLAFSSRNIQPSLKNIFKELKNDLKIDIPLNGDLTSWANQGVLLLNRIMTTQTGKPMAHSNKGWEIFTDKIIKALDNKDKPIAFVLWGKKAQEVIPHIKSKHHLILKSGHPSPYSFHLFKNNKHFSQINDFLIQTNQKPIIWKII